MKQYWNEGWDFAPVYTEKLLKADGLAEGMEQVRLPHTAVEIPLHYFDSELCESISGYRKIFHAPADWKEKHVFITFEGAAHEATVYVNGEEVLVHQCGYTSFSFELSEYVRFGEENVLTVRLDSRSILNQPPFGERVDYMTYGGLYREVYIEVHPKYYLEKVDFEVGRVMETTKIIEVDITLTEGCPKYQIKQTLLDVDGRVVVDFNPITTTQVAYGVTDVERWTPKNPKLYQLKTQLYLEGALADEQITRFAFRKTELKSDGLYFNGELFPLEGINRHQIFPYVGYAMPERVQKRDVDILMDELGVNGVRVFHYPPSQYFLDACDERGLLVYLELPDWYRISKGKNIPVEQKLKEKEWQELLTVQKQEIIEQNKHHPAVIFRPESKSGRKKSYMINGFEKYMTDYNTSQDFGSGDEVRYCGEMDMFRNRKQDEERVKSESTQEKSQNSRGEKAVAKTGKGLRGMLCLDTDTEVLVEQNTYDVASVRITLRDENGKCLPLANEAVRLEAEGDIALIGPDMIALQKGMGGTYVKSLGRSGAGTLRATLNTGEYAEIGFSVLA